MALQPITIFLQHINGHRAQYPPREETSSVEKMIWIRQPEERESIV